MQVPKYKHLMLRSVLHLPVQMHRDHLKCRCVFTELLPTLGESSFTTGKGGLINKVSGAWRLGLTDATNPVN